MPEALAGFHAEVRNARQVSHPNVCRVYDIGEVNGQHFLTMEGSFTSRGWRQFLLRAGPVTGHSCGDPITSNLYDVAQG
jgi:hypothetical protein